MYSRLVISLFVSAVMLVAVYAHGFYNGSDVGNAPPLDIELDLIIGQEIEQKDINLIMPAKDRRAVLSEMLQGVQADNYRFLRLKFSHAKNVEDILFFWRLESSGHSINTAVLPINADGLLLDLGDKKNWNGNITEIGLIIYGGQDAQIGVSSMQLLSPDIWRLIYSEFNQWIAVSRWDQKTAHFLRWDSININPVSAVAAWLLAAFVLYAFFGKERIKAAMMLMIFGWVILDLRWYWEQYYQLRDLENQLIEFPKENVLSLDADLYAEIDRLKGNVLPQKLVRIQIVKSGPANDYMRWKAQYYLLPHPVYNYGDQPAWNKLQSGDWVWAMGEIRDFSYDDMIGLYNKRNHLSAIKVDEGPIGTLYKIL